LGALISVLAGIGRKLAPLALFALLAIGIHSGSDRVDDHTLLAYNWLDSQLDRAVAAALDQWGAWLDTPPERTNHRITRFASLIDWSTNEWAARWTALVVELAAVLILLPVLLPRKPAPLPLIARGLVQDFTLLRWTAPLTVFAASLAGLLVVAKEAQLLTWSGVKLGTFSERAFAASMVGSFALILVALRLVGPGLLRALGWGHRKAERDRDAGVPPLKRRLRGLGVTTLALPIAVLALWEGTPVLATLRALVAF